MCTASHPSFASPSHLFCASLLPQFGCCTASLHSPAHLPSSDYPLGNAWSLKVTLAPLKGAATCYSQHILFSHASLLPFVMSTSCTERRRQVGLSTFSRLSLRGADPATPPWAVELAPSLSRAIVLQSLQP